MFFPSLAIVTASFLAATPLMWAHAPLHTAVILIASAIAAGAAVMSILDQRFRVGLIVAASLLVVSGFAVCGAKAMAALDLTAGYLFFVAGLVPQVRRIAAPATIAVPRPAEERRAA
jgi:hypothetical protein